jgi:hypothetical protein
MSIQRLDVSYAPLPAALLDSIKAHLRVEHDRDDTLIRAYISAAIGICERKCNVSLNPAEYMVTLDELRPRGPKLWAGGTWRHSWLLPLNNVREFELLDSATPPNDLSANFELWNADPGGNGSSYLLGLDGYYLPTGAQITSLTVGVLDQETLAPAFFSLIARITGSLYENREASTDLVGDGFDSELIALWRPDA